MASAKMETAAEKYRRQKKEQQQLHSVTCPGTAEKQCGFTWQCRRASKEFWVTSGMLPTHMIDVMARLANLNKQSAAAAEITESLSSVELVNLTVFSNQVVLYTAVDPQIVETPTEPNQIAQRELDDCCYACLRDWQMTGGDEAARLETFPNK